MASPRIVGRYAMYDAIAVTRRLRLWLAVGAVLLGGAAAACGHDDVSPTSSSVTAEPSAQTADITSHATTSSETASETTAPPLPAPVAPMPVAPPPGATVAASVPRKVTPPKAKPTTHCDPPYTLTPAGTKRYKIGCQP